MTIRLRSLVLGLGLLLAVVPALAAQTEYGTRLRSFDEVPAVSTFGGGNFSATLSEDRTEITYELTYFNIQGIVTQAHIHLGQMSVNGGITVFLCSNLGNGPAGTQACPADPATISGTIQAGDVLAIPGQGMEAGSFRELLRALRSGVTYANVHSTLFPGGEIRGQIRVVPGD